MAEHIGGSAPEQAAGRGELRAVDSPSISPAVESSTAPEIAIDSTAPEARMRAPRFISKARHRRTAVLAASVVIAGALGTIVGALTSAGINKAPPPLVDAAAVKERQALHKSIAHLSREVTTLKASLEAANKSSHAQIAKLNARIAALPKLEITGSVPAAPTPKATPTPPSPPPVLQAPPATLPLVMTPMPAPRPSSRIAALESNILLAVVPDWTIRSARDGAVFVEHYGELYQVVIGAILPGLGPVKAIDRQEGRWTVVTPKGIIVRR